jgi:hypothetical protein
LQLETLTYTARGGWSARFPELDSPRTLVIVFGAPCFGAESAALDELRRAYPISHRIGCSTSGEIHGASLADESLSVAIARFDASSIASASASVSGAADSSSAGREIARTLAREDLRAILVLSEGLNVNGSELVRGICSGLPSSVVVTGGLAGDGDRFQRTWVLGRERPEAGLVAAVGLYGEKLRVGHGSKGGWDKFGPERRITRSRANVLDELDGRPALQIYKRYLGERASGLPATALLFPLAVRSDLGDTKVLVRTVLSIDEARQSMTFAGDMPEGHVAQLMHANLERLIEGASTAAQHALASGIAGAGEVLSIAISCVGRRLILGVRAEEEIEAALAELPRGTRQVGFYGYGEISPSASGQCSLHNQTMTLTTIGESRDP